MIPQQAYGERVAAIINHEVVPRILRHVRFHDMETVQVHMDATNPNRLVLVVLTDVGLYEFPFDVTSKGKEH